MQLVICILLVYIHTIQPIYKNIYKNVQNETAGFYDLNSENTYYYKYIIFAI